ncbi:hypothetical protein, partial [Methylobacterium sp. WL119]|uniref:hypothetical protein n=1 Tax=Methylobacterium sp. WL119 TaxID=2603888 RepID=UPI001AEED1D2
LCKLLIAEECHDTSISQSHCINGTKIEWVHVDRHAMVLFYLIRSKRCWTKPMCIVERQSQEPERGGYRAVQGGSGSWQTT